MDRRNYINTKIRKMVICERKTGSKYQGRISENGIRKSFYGPTKAEVRNKAKDWLIHELDKEYIDSTSTLGSFIEYWLRNYKLNKVEPSTYERLESVYIHQIKNQIGNVKLCDLKTPTIQKLIDGYACPESEDDMALAYSGLKRLKELLNASLNVALEEGLIHKNPCKMVILPNRHCVVTPSRKQLALSDQQIEEFKNAALARCESRGEFRSRDGIVLLIILSLGLRVGEALALEWTDFNMDDRIVHINKTVQSSKQRGTIVRDGTKTASGTRVLAMNDNIVLYLNELKEYDKRNNIKSDIVCCTSTGKRQNARNLQRSLTRILSHTDIEEHISLHTLRHTFGSALIRKGVQIEVVSKLMGHSNITVTYTKYIHVLQEQQAMAMQMTTIV